jgi:sterol 24-C-methyltransferase
MAPASLEQENHVRDAEFNRAMHGKSAQSRGGFAALRGKDSAAQKAAVDEYFKHWDNKSAEDETEETRAVSNPSLLPSGILEF